MKHTTVEDVISSYPRTILSTVQGGGGLSIQGGADYQFIHAIRKLLQANARAIGTHLGGETLGHLGIIVSVAAYTVVAPPHPWENPAAPGRGPEVIAADTSAQISAAGHLWEENVQIFRTYCTVEQ
jgi:hypothetical protein